MQKSKSLGPGITLGWASLDKATGGARPGQLVTWIAPPNLGASYLLACSSLAAHAQGHEVLLVSMKMSAISTARLLLGIRSGINPEFIMRGTLSKWGEEIVWETIKQLRDEAPFVLASGYPTVDTVDVLIQHYTPDVLYIDSQYLMLPSHRQASMKRFELLGQIALARNILINQWVPYNREQGHFQEGDLRKIGGIDTVSSIVISITEGQPPNESITRSLNIVKNREGSLETVLINFRLEPINFSQILPSENGISNIDWTA